MCGKTLRKIKQTVKKKKNIRDYVNMNLYCDSASLQERYFIPANVMVCFVLSSLLCYQLGYFLVV